MVHGRRAAAQMRSQGGGAARVALLVALALLSSQQAEVSPLLRLRVASNHTFRLSLVSTHHTSHTEIERARFAEGALLHQFIFVEDRDYDIGRHGRTPFPTWLHCACYARRAPSLKVRRGALLLRDAAGGVLAERRIQKSA